MKHVNKQERKGVPFWLIATLYVFGIVVCANIMYGTILLVAVNGYTNWYFWNLIASGVGTMIFIGFLFYLVRDKITSKKKKIEDK